MMLCNDCWELVGVCHAAARPQAPPEQRGLPLGADSPGTRRGGVDRARPSAAPRLPSDGTIREASGASADMGLPLARAGFHTTWLGVVVSAS